MGLVIRRKVTLEFLGDEYKDAYLIFQAIPVSKLQEVLAKMPKETDPEETKMNSIGLMLDVLKELFLDGKFPNAQGKLEDVTAEDMDNIDAETAIHCFKVLSGQDENLEPASASSSTPSIPAESPEANPLSNT